MKFARLWLPLILIGVLLGLVAVPTAAQTIPAPRAAAWSGEAAAVLQQQLVNPKTVEFAPSPDHSAVVDTVTVLSSYAIELLNGATVAATKDIGKPAPAAGVITYGQLETVYAGLPAASYTARIVSKGPGGENRTPASDPFVALSAPRAAPAKPVIK